jgi:hypothetical protein
MILGASTQKTAKLEPFLQYLDQQSQHYQFDIFARTGRSLTGVENGRKILQYYQNRAILAIEDGWQIPVWKGCREISGFVQSWSDKYFPGKPLQEVRHSLCELLESAPSPIEVDPWDLWLLSRNPSVHQQICDSGYCDTRHAVLYASVGACCMRVLLHLGPFNQDRFLQRFFQFQPQAADAFYSWEGFSHPDLLTFEFSRFVAPKSRASLLSMRECRAFFFETLREYHQGPVCLLLQFQKDLRLIQFLFKGFEPLMFDLKNPNVVTVALQS